MVDFIEISIKGGFRTVPTGLRLNVVGAHPALKRGTNNHCTYGAGARLPFGNLADRSQSSPFHPVGRQKPVDDCYKAD